MYGGLFGDLPEASNSKGKGNTTDQKTDGHGAVIVSTFTNSETDDNRIRKLDGPKSRQESKTSSSSVVRSLGATGTSMAFIPAAARRKKAPPPPIAPVVSTCPSITTTTAVNSTQQIQREISRSVVASSKANHHPTDAVAARTLSSINVEPFQVVHEQASSEPDKTPAVAGPSVKIQQQHEYWTSEDSQHQQQQQHHHGENEEPESLRRLHEKATEKDPYDPMFPNDLLLYWESKAFEKERKRLEMEHRESVKQQERLRQQLEKERQDLANSGNMARLAQHEQDVEQQQRERQRVMSGGRGRGLSNLPAWLVEKQRQEARGVGQSDGGGGDPNKRQRLNNDDR
jgi:hypothetical protein